MKNQAGENGCYTVTGGRVVFVPYCRRVSGFTQSALRCAILVAQAALLLFTLAALWFGCVLAMSL